MCYYVWSTFICVSVSVCPSVNTKATVQVWRPRTACLSPFFLQGDFRGSESVSMLGCKRLYLLSHLHAHLFGFRHLETIRASIWLALYLGWIGLHTKADFKSSSSGWLCLGFGIPARHPGKSVVWDQGLLTAGGSGPSWPAVGHAYQHFKVMKLVCVNPSPLPSHTCELDGITRSDGMLATCDFVFSKQRQWDSS